MKAFIIIALILLVTPTLAGSRGRDTQPLFGPFQGPGVSGTVSFNGTTYTITRVIKCFSDHTTVFRSTTYVSSNPPPDAVNGIARVEYSRSC